MPRRLADVVRVARRSPEQPWEHALRRAAQVLEGDGELALYFDRVAAFVRHADACRGQPGGLTHRPESALLGARHRNQAPARRFGEQRYKGVFTLWNHN